MLLSTAEPLRVGGGVIAHVSGVLERLKSAASSCGWLHFDEKKKVTTLVTAPVDAGVVASHTPDAVVAP